MAKEIELHEETSSASKKKFPTWIVIAEVVTFGCFAFAITILFLEKNYY